MIWWLAKGPIMQDNSCCVVRVEKEALENSLNRCVSFEPLVVVQCSSKGECGC